MDLQILSSSISSLQSLKNLAQENAQLKNDLFQLQQTFTTYKEKVHNSIKLNLLLHSQALLSKQSEIESLQMVNSKLAKLRTPSSSLTIFFSVFQNKQVSAIKSRVSVFQANPRAKHMVSIEIIFKHK